jgi:hypothetical protein
MVKNNGTDEYLQHEVHKHALIRNTGMGQVTPTISQSSSNIAIVWQYNIHVEK